ncbi:MAG: class I SAM-dependent methyltransferase [Candidatus Methylomirabilota bacterium]
MALIKPPAPVFRILDLGCGVGIYAVQIAKRFPGARIHGVDLSPTHLAAAATLAARFGVADRIHWSCADLTEFLPLEPADIVIAAEVLEHLPDPLPALTSIREAIRPTGQIIVSVPQFLAEDHGGTWIYHRQPSGPAFSSIETVDPSLLSTSAEVFTYYHRHYHADELQALLVRARLIPHARHACFWIRPPAKSAPCWRALDYLNQRLALTTFDQFLLRRLGQERAQTLLWECRPV